MKINGTLLRKKTLWILGLIASGSIVSQFAAINHFLSYHPRLAPISFLLFSALTLIHNPQAEQIVDQVLDDSAPAAKN